MKVLNIIFLSIFFLVLIAIVSSKLLAELITEADIDERVEEFIQFYEKNRIEFKGHLWWPVLLEHHPLCPCEEFYE